MTQYLETPRNWETIPTNAPTAYEVVAQAEGAEPMVLGYTARTGKHGLMNLAHAHGDAVLAACADEDAPLTIKGGGTRCTLRLGGNMTIKYSGRTERSASAEG